MKWDDLLNVPFRMGGRGMDGMDCYGIVVECCRRAGSPIADPFRELAESIPMEEAMRIRGQEINVAEADSPAVGRIVYAELEGKSHVGYIVERGKVLHAVRGGKPRVTPVGVFRKPIYYDVLPLEEEW